MQSELFCAQLTTEGLLITAPGWGSTLPSDWGLLVWNPSSPSSWDSQHILSSCRRPQFDSRVGKISWRRDRLPTSVFLGFPRGSAGKKSACNEEDLGTIPVLGRFPWRRERLPTPVFWPGEFHERYSPWGHKESDTTEQLSLSLSSRNGLPLFGGHFLSISLGAFRVGLAPFLLSSCRAARNPTLGEIFTPSPSWRCGSPAEDAGDLGPNCVSCVNTPQALSPVFLHLWCPTGHPCGPSAPSLSHPAWQPMRPLCSGIS